MRLKLGKKQYYVDFDTKSVYNLVNGAVKGKLRKQEKVNEILEIAEQVVAMRKVK